jgi:hypothetical protein
VRMFENFDDLKSAVGTVVGASDWVEVTQNRIDKFAAATGDDQWIHVDVDRAARELPSQSTIAHGLYSFIRAFVCTVCHGCQRHKEHPELRRKPHSLSRASAGRLTSARPNWYRQRRGRSLSWTPGNIWNNHRVRGARSSRVCRRNDRDPLFVRPPTALPHSVRPNRIAGNTRWNGSRRFHFLRHQTLTQR